MAMTDKQLEPTVKEAPDLQDNARKMALIVYALYLASFIVGITFLAGVVVAYVYRNDAGDWLVSHYRFQIRTFWMFALFSIVGALLALVFVGWFVLVFAAVWLIVRCVIGIKRLGERKPIEDPASWLFGTARLV
jgi:uncharacterized membrane protein